MKPVSEWDLNHMLHLPLGEFDWIEFKGRRGLDLTLPNVDENKILDELSKQLSAFANSGGGVLVYGVLSPPDGKPRSIDDGGIAVAMRNPNVREWLEDVIPNLVEFPLNKFNVYTLTNQSGAPALSADRCIVVMDIPSSDEAPHQARDRKYYARVGGKSRPVGHRIVTDMFHRKAHANFDVSFALYSETWIPRSIVPMPPMKPKRAVRLIAQATNTGRVYAKYVNFNLLLPEELLPIEECDEESVRNVKGIRYQLRTKTNTQRDVLARNATLGTQHYGPSWFDPILPGLSKTWEIDFDPQLRPEHLKEQKLHWSIYCDNAPKISGEAVLKSLRFAIMDEHKVDSSEPYYPQPKA